MAHIYSNDRLEEKFLNLLCEDDPRNRIYVYRMFDNQMVKPYLYAGPLFERLEDYVRDKFGGGKFYIMIRRGEKMLLAGTIATGPPLNGLRNQQNELNSRTI